MSIAAVGFISQHLSGVTPAPSVGAIEIVYGIGYVGTLVGLAWVARAGASATSRVLFLDALAAACGAAVVVWELIEPALDGPGAADRAAAIVYMLADLVATIFVLHLVVRKPANRAARWFLLFCLLTWFADSLWAIGDLGAWSRVLYPCCYVAFGAGVVSRDAVTLTESEPETSDGPARLWTLGPAVVALPVALLISSMRSDPVPILAAALAAIACVAVLVRVGYLLASHRAQTRELSELAVLDQLTRLPNRRALHERLECPAGTAREGGVVLFIDLDGFKRINDRFGHRRGDTVLVVTAERLRGVVRDGDLVCRYAGDEFVIVCDHIVDDGEVDDLVARIHQVVTAPITIDSQSVVVGASIGAAPITADCSPDQMLAAADARMYENKRSARRATAGSLR